jgi:hypothetical protein
MKRFVIIVPYASPEIQGKINTYFNDQGVSWWHWCADCWLVVLPDDLTSTGEIRGLVTGLVGAPIQVLILSVEIPALDPWSGYGPKTWEDWMRIAWDAGSSHPPSPADLILPPRT